MGLKKNFIYSSILTVSGYIFPLLTYPYVSRVLGANNLGICNFVNSIIDYYLIFSSLGIISVGIREIAKCKSNIKKQSIVFSSLFTINIIATLIIVIVLFVSICFVQKLQQYQTLLYVGIIKLVFNAFLIEWYYQGIQNFKYITLRSVFVKIIYVISVFVFIHTEDDYNLYFYITTGVTVINSLINWNKKEVLFSVKNIKIKKYLKPVFAFGYNKLMINLYTTFNVVFLGLFVSEIEVGYYTTATKLYSIIMAFYSALTSVLIPKMSQLFADKKIKDVKCMVNKIVDILLSVSIPIIVYSEFNSNSIIYIISGKGYEGAVIPFMIVMPMMFTIGIEQIFNQQILMCLNRNKAVMIVSSVAAIVGIILNFAIVREMKSCGSALCWLSSDIVGLFTVCYYVKRYSGIVLPYKRILHYMAFSIPYVLISLGCDFLFENHNYMAMSFSAMLFFVYFFFLNVYVVKNVVVSNVFRSLVKIK